jgi:hypothetical protein
LAGISGNHRPVIQAGHAVFGISHLSDPTTTNK